MGDGLGEEAELDHPWLPARRQPEALLEVVDAPQLGRLTVDGRLLAIARARDGLFKTEVVLA